MHDDLNYLADNQVAFLPDLAVLRYLTPEECLDFWFPSDRNLIRAREEQPHLGRVKTVCIPLIGTSGVAFENKAIAHAAVPVKVGDSAVSFRSYGQIVRQFADLGCDIYFYVCPSMEFLGLPPCHVVDIRNAGSPKACFNKAKTRKILKHLIEAGVSTTIENMDGLTHKLKGVVIDITDLWGMGGEDDTVYLTCFCDECKKYFTDKGLDLRLFQNRPNPWGLALQPRDSGVKYIDNIGRDETVESIIGKSRLFGFDKAFSNNPQDLRRAAEALKLFMDVRHGMVEGILDDIFSSMRKSPGCNTLQRIVLTEGADYDWTSGTFLASLSKKIVDEVWFDPTEKAPNITIPHRFFMCSRSTYFINAFFEFLWNAGDQRIRATTGLARLNRDEIRAQLVRRSRMAINNILVELQRLRFIFEESTGFNGFVAPVLDDDIVQQLVDNVNIADGLTLDTPEAGTDLLHELFRKMSQARSSGRGQE